MFEGKKEAFYLVLDSVNNMETCLGSFVFELQKNSLLECSASMKFIGQETTSSLTKLSSNQNTHNQNVFLQALRTCFLFFHLLGRLIGGSGRLMGATGPTSTSPVLFRRLSSLHAIQPRSRSTPFPNPL